MTARVTGWAADPHEADAPEERGTCDGCGVESEDINEFELIAEEVGYLELRVAPGKAWLCERCDDARRTSWDDADTSLTALHALGAACGLDTQVHPSLLSVRIAAHLPYHETKNPGGRRQ